MGSTADIEKRLVELDREIHSILNMVRKKNGRSSKELVESACGAWGYDVDSEEFVDQLRKSSRLDWIE
ncbi:hypothetical protein MSBR3_2933 [Methanosarcina barkeri 3]|uniref:Uncharacterized protein n=1 Tax=Methanosarcina barkeri 3 TaxID=1434107 RepID=A0A0E3SMJ6_METBA|nr:hypothetical protein [Methanosarcina barkeri]AKB83511.1 hypothetical protein MSBR3_2933 [Methanosarcina barkeri 3]